MTEVFHTLFSYLVFPYFLKKNWVNTHTCNGITWKSWILLEYVFTLSFISNWYQGQLINLVALKYNICFLYVAEWKFEQKHNINLKVKYVHVTQDCNYPHYLSKCTQLHFYSEIAWSWLLHRIYCVLGVFSHSSVINWELTPLQAPKLKY